MAVTKTTNILRVVCKDESGGEKNFNLDDYKPDLTLAQVTAAFNDFFNKPMGTDTFDPLLKTSTGLKLVGVDRAELVDTVVTTTYLS